MFDKVDVEIPCPACNRKNPLTLDRKKPNPSIKCRGCGKTIEVNTADYEKGLKSVDKSIADFKKSLSKFGQ